MQRFIFITVFFLEILFYHHLSIGQTDFIEKERRRFQSSTDRPMEVMLDIDAGEVIVEKGSDAYSGIVIMEYTSKQFRTRIDFDERKNRLKIFLDKRNWHKWSKKGRDDKDNWAFLKLQLPHSVEILFDSKVKAGEMLMTMGGLHLKEFSLHIWAGEVEVRFDELNPTLMDYLDIDAKVGEARLINLGNARFRKADINGGIGDIKVDFTGELLSESRAKVDIDIGEANILLPQDIGVRMEIGGDFSFLSSKSIDYCLYRRGRWYYSENYDEKKEKFFLKITPGLGELNIKCE